MTERRHRPDLRSGTGVGELDGGDRGGSDTQVNADGHRRLCRASTRSAACQNIGAGAR